MYKQHILLRTAPGASDLTLTHLFNWITS